MTQNLQDGLNNLYIRTNEKDGSEYNLYIKSRITGEEFLIEVIDLSPTSNKFTFSFDLPTDLVEGEYVYSVKSADNSVIYRTGLAYYITLNKAKASYNRTKNNIVYERNK